MNGGFARSNPVPRIRSGISDVAKGAVLDDDSGTQSVYGARPRGAAAACLADQSGLRFAIACGYSIGQFLE